MTVISQEALHNWGELVTGLNTGLKKMADMLQTTSWNAEFVILIPISLTHWGGVTHLYFNNLATIGSNNIGPKPLSDHMLEYC